MKKHVRMSLLIAVLLTTIMAAVLVDYIAPSIFAAHLRSTGRLPHLPNRSSSSPSWQSELAGLNDLEIFDVSGRKELWGGYHSEETYALKMPVYLRHVDERVRSEGAALVPPRDPGPAGSHLGILLYKNPGTLEDLENLRDSWPTGAGIVEAGARIKCIRIMARQSKSRPDLTFFAYPVGRILDGRHAGEIVDLTDVSEFCRAKTASTACLAPDRDILTVLPSDGKSVNP